MLSILSYLRSGNYIEAIIAILSRCFVVFCCLPIHELAHGLMADKLGDHTARNQGRLTFNPFAHLNLLGTIMIFLFGIGYANPVPINPNNFKNPKKGMALTALAGPASNLLMAFVSLFFYYGILDIAGLNSTVTYAVAYFFYFAAKLRILSELAKCTLLTLCKIPFYILIRDACKKRSWGKRNKVCRKPREALDTPCVIVWSPSAGRDRRTISRS